MVKAYKKIITELVTSILVILIPCFLGIIFWKQLPQELPVHYNIKGEIDSYANKAIGVFFAPVFLVIVNIILFGLAVFEAKRENSNIEILDNKKIVRILLMIMPCVSLYTGFLTYRKFFEIKVDVVFITSLIAGIIFCILGNYLPKTKANNMIGARTPWSINNSYNWHKTNKLAGILMVIEGILFIVDAFIQVGGGNGVFFSILGSVFLLLIIVFIYSYLIGNKI